MKKSLFLALVFLFNISIFAQDRAFIVNESFNSSNMPEEWYCTGEGMDNFNITTSNHAGGDPNELHLKSGTPITSGIHLVMASADLSGVTEAGISFKHYLNNYQESSTIGIATSSDNGVTWNTAWSQAYSASGGYSINETISTSDMGKSNVLFCLFFEGNTYNINHWYFDDIRIFTQGGNDTDEAMIQISNIDMQNVVPSGNTDIVFTVNNTGSVAITSFEARYKIDGEDAATETFHTDLPSYGNGQFTFATKPSLAPGTFNISIEILSVNGEAVSDAIIMTKEVKTYIRTVVRTPMIEHFSSSTCIPCVSVDIAMTELTHDNPGRYTYTKFPMEFPGTGDPYTTDECNARAYYYNALTVPTLAIDGYVQSSAISQETLDEKQNATSYVDIVGAFETEGNIIKVTADIMSYIDMPDVKVLMTVNEKTTTGNKGTNGAEEFHHIMMKMVGGYEGIEASFEAGVSQRFEFTHDMSTTFMEEIDDLEVSVWIQDYDSKEVHNSSFLYEYMQHPYPAVNLTVTENGTNTTISWDAPEERTPTGYNLYINNVLTAENTTSTTYSASGSEEIHFVEVVAVYEDGILSIGTTNMRSASIFPPANVTATANEGEGNITVTWDAAEEATAYKLYRNNSFLADLTATSYTDSDIEQGVTYCYTVRSLCDNSISTFSQESCAHVGETPCIAPDGINATIEENVAEYEYKFKATITWNAVTNAEYYALYINGDLFGYSSSTAYIAGSNREGTYDINVVTVCENGESEFSETFKLVIKGDAIDEQQHSSHLYIYPNPAENTISISSDDDVEEINIYNVTGVNVYSSSNISGNDIDISDLSKGLYLIKIRTTETETTRQFIKK